MSNKGTFWTIILASLVFSNCTMELEIPNFNHNQETSVSCITERDCESGICLSSGKCAIRVEEGMACDEMKRCDIDLECTEGFCQKRPEIECYHDSQCASGQCLPDGRCARDVSDAEDDRQP